MIYFQVMFTALVVLIISGVIIKEAPPTFAISKLALYLFYVPVALIFFAALITCTVTPLAFVWSL